MGLRARFDSIVCDVPEMSREDVVAILGQAGCDVRDMVDEAGRSVVQYSWMEIQQGCEPFNVFIRWNGAGELVSGGIRLADDFERILGPDEYIERFFS